MVELRQHRGGIALLLAALARAVGVQGMLGLALVGGAGSLLGLHHGASRRAALWPRGRAGPVLSREGLSEPV